MPSLFISHKRDDKVAVTKISDRLHDEFHYEVWIDAKSIPGGEDWRAEIRKGIDKADVMLLMLTPDACASEQVKEEVDYAKSVGRKIFPLQIKKVSETDQNKLGVAHLNYIDFVTGADDRFAWEKLLNDLPEVLPRDKRLLNPAFKKLHRSYLRSLFTRYGTVNLSYLLDAAPRESVKLMDVYVPLKLGVSFNIEVVKGEYADWWLRDQDAPRQPAKDMPDGHQPKSLNGFGPQADGLVHWVERMKDEWAKYRKEHEDEQAKKAEKDREALEDGTYYWNRIESETAPALMPHLVITGNPGSGKSTLLKHLALCLAGDGLAEGEESEADRNKLGFWPLPAYTPVFIELRALVRTAFPNLNDEVTLAKFLDYLRADLEQLDDLGDYADDLTDQLREGSAMLFLDGLDEVPDAETPERRQQIKDLVHLLRGQFKQCRILITSRPYAYAGDWQLRAEDGFGQVKMADLDSDRLQELALRLFRAVLPAELVEGEAEAFQAQVGKVPENLRSNPLYFTLMAAIWLNSRTKATAERLPITPAAIYRECVEMLIRRWTHKDMQKEESLAGAIGLDENGLRRLLETLAYQVHSEAGEKDDAVFESGDITTIVRRDLKLKLHDYDLLIDALAQRAGVTYERAPEQFQFAHRSFQEHLAACYLLREGRYPAQVTACLREKPLLWRNVLELLPDEAHRAGFNLAELLKAWLPKDLKLPDEADDPAWTSIYHAGRILNDFLPPEDDVQEIYRPRLQKALVKLLAVGALTPVDRAKMGRVLSRLGDIRRGVGVIAAGAQHVAPLPDIDWVEIPAGTFLMGSDKAKDAQAADDEMPQHEVYLPTYLISRYPVTYQQFQAFLEAKDGFENDEWWDGMPEEYRKQPMAEQQFKFDNHPRDSVSWYQAVAFCRWLTMRYMREGLRPSPTMDNFVIGLPTEAEWEKAARGTNGLIYPYGDKYDPTKGNTHDTGIRQTSAVGMFPGGASPYGVLDMSGNVWEWCSSLKKPYPFDAKDGREDLSETGVRVLRGGSWNNLINGARAASRVRDSPLYRNDLIGFRVCAVPINSGI